MPRRLISSGATFEAQIGYSRAMASDLGGFVARTTGFDYDSTISSRLVNETMKVEIEVTALKGSP